MNKTNLKNIIKKKHNLTGKQSSEIVDSVFEEILNSLANGNNVSLTNFGTFRLSLLKGKKGKIPKSNTEYITEDKYVVRFAPSKNTKKDIASQKI